nr:trimethylamine methyltransferase family protein [Anaerolineae bacterium]
SPATVVLGAEVIAQVRIFAAGLEQADAAGLIEEIAAAGPGGSFLESPDTLRRLRTGYHSSPVFGHFGFEKWQELGRPSAERRLRDTTVELMARARPPENQGEILARGEGWMRSRSI